MNKKKLMGTIIGVTLFAALIAGATYALLTITATTTNGNYAGLKTKNFIINYAGGTQINAISQLSSATTAAITSKTSASDVGDGWLAVTASKTANSAKASNFYIKLHVTSNALTTKAITYAVCKGACPTGVALATVSGGTATCANGVTSCGTIANGVSNTDVILLNDTSTFNTDDAVAATTYNVYFWLDSATLVTADIGKAFSGYIFATATQGN